MVIEDEEFTSIKLKKKLRQTKNSIIKSKEIFKADVLGTEVPVVGKAIRDFVQAYEQKLGEYLDKPFLTILVDGALLKGVKNFKKYVLGTAICEHYGFPPKRFIEVQFYYHDKWKGHAPSLFYVTSLTSEWNSVGRYKQYCDTYKNEIDYFDDGHDNVDAAYCSPPVRGRGNAPNPSLVRIYEEMIEFQIAATGRPRKIVLRILGNPENSRLPFRYLKNLDLYRELVNEDAWGAGPYKFDFYQKLKQEIENSKNGR